MSKYIHRPGYELLWAWFGLSYASWLTLPRVMMHQMPDEWQRKMAELLQEWGDTWDTNKVTIDTRVNLTENDKPTKMPEWMKQYRHPDTDYIESLKKKKEIPCPPSR